MPMIIVNVYRLCIDSAVKKFFSLSKFTMNLVQYESFLCRIIVQIMLQNELVHSLKKLKKKI